jgi:hypothetical protein
MEECTAFKNKVTAEKEALSCVALHMPGVGLRLSATAAVRKISAVGPKLSAAAAVWKMSAWEWRREFRPRPGTASSAWNHRERKIE